MFEIIPAIWIYEGKCVRLTRGDFKTGEIISTNPLQLARSFEEHGMSQVHLVDLDGAKRREPKNYHILETIAGHTNLMIDFTGGISTDGDVNKAFEYGAKTITASSLAARNPEKFTQWIISYGRERIKLAADINPADYKIKVEGWMRKTEIDLFDHITYFFDRGLKYLKCSDISRDGVMDGPNLELYKQVCERFPDMKLIAAGGVRSADDFRRLKKLGISGVIFGSAFYENKITIEDIDAFLAEQ
ncbi:MAG TPA: 1-(5-phosphoribosyl)-5-[(5-phosphoribosylamino)methylideneamino] imidazole-4-carboxamide isomerase [Cyclobacteriaceae bacterium]|nr:1-(5-phosphoribosyl)-5-[(5-phosphoribosylamino)methylideneamino] imidazole-4-carboxamide isomerase [Cyclobacteriaceae bacterium]